MVYSLLSTDKGQCGTTTAASMVALSLGLYKTMDNVLLTQTDMSSTTLAKYFGRDEARTDYSKNLAQICAMLGQNSMGRIEDVATYMSQIRSNVYLYSSSEQNRDEEEVVDLFTTFIQKMPYQHIVLDVNTDTGSQLTKKAIELSDEIIIVINQNKCLEEKTKKLLSKFSNKSVSVMINLYDASIGRSIVTSKLGVRSGKVLTLSYSPYIRRLGNFGRLEEVFEMAKNKNGDLLDISAQMQFVSRTFAANKSKGKRG